MSPEQSDSQHFYMDARGNQEASGGRVILRDGRARLVVYGAHAIDLTRIQTEELGRWLNENAPVHLQGESEALAELLALQDAILRLQERLSRSQWIVCAEALAILDASSST